MNIFIWAVIFPIGFVMTYIFWLEIYKDISGKEEVSPMVMVILGNLLTLAVVSILN